MEKISPQCFLHSLFFLAMQPSLGIFLAVLLTTGAALRCEICSNNGNRCSGPLQTCSGGRDICAIWVSEVSGDIKLQRIVKNCEFSEFCIPGPTSMHIDNVTSIITNGACCVGSNCNNVSLKLPAERLLTNGKHCPSCYSAKNVCVQKDVDCLGTDDYCFETYVRSGNDPSNVTLKGCTTKAVCKALSRKELFLGGFLFQVHRTECRQASKSPPSIGYSFLAVFGFLLKMSFF